MNRRRILRAVGFSAFLLVWTAGVAVVTLQVEQAGAPLAAAPALPAGQAPPELPAPPELADAEAWSAAMAQLARRSEVMNGSWQPAARAVPQIRPVAIVEPAPAAPPAVEPAAAVAPTIAEQRVVKAPVARLARFWPEKARARDALRGGRFSEAYALLRPRVAEARHDSEYLGLLALAALRIGSPGEAMVLYQRLAAIEPDSGRWHMGLALAQESLGLDATEEYRQALALADDADGMRSLLSAHLEGGGVT